MLARHRRVHALIAACVLLTSTVFIVTANQAQASASTNTNACRSNATGTYSDLPVTLSGDGSPNPASLGVDTVTLSNQSLQVDVPGDLFLAGYRLGLLTVGENSIPTDATANIGASNTAEGSASQVVSTTATTTITDPTPDDKTSGDESATPLFVSLGLSDTTWTPTGGDIVFSQGDLAVSALVAGGIITVTLTCGPGMSSVDGSTFTPAVPTPFESVTVVSDDGPTTTTTAQATTTTTQATTTTTEATTTTTEATTTTTVLEVDRTPVTGTETYAASCTNSVTPDESEISFEVTGTVPRQALADEAITLSDQTWRVTVPGSVFETGINLGLISPPQTINADIDVTVSATNTVEGTKTASGIPAIIDVTGPVDTTTEIEVPDMVFTVTDGTIDFAMSSASVAIDLGFPEPITLSCQAPTDAGPFVSSDVVGESDVTPAVVTTTISGAGSAQVRGVTVIGSLPATGAPLAAQAVAALALIDLGYLAWSASRPPKRPGRRRTA